MASKIESLIEEIEDYIESCKYKAFSNTEIIVDKEEIVSMLKEMRSKTPKEIEKYQQVISNREEILQDARNKAQAIIDKATAETTELISEHEIMLQAYHMADGIVDTAKVTAQEIIDGATAEANSLKESAMAYTDQILADVEALISHYLDQSASRYNSLYDSLGECLGIVQQNREELAPPEVPLDVQVENLLAEADDSDDGFEKIDL